MRTLSLLTLLLTACETTEPSGSPFSPVEVAPPAAAGPEGTVDEAGEEPVDPRFSLYDGLVEISSEELGGRADPGADGDVDAASGEGAEGGAGGSEGGDAVADAAGAEVEPEGPEPQPAVVGTLTMGSSGGAPAPGWSAAAGGWPLRLVSTTPGAQPPRAILGLPDGQELVVRPGTMVPAAGVVVMSVGAGSVELARILPAGDHALVQSQTLTPQY